MLVPAEGVLMYLDPEGLRSFLDSSPSGSGAGTELAADYFHPRVALGGRLGARPYAVAHPRADGGGSR
ncbi:hypothetical protein ABZ891_33175 [Streptomyces sp. NPDC047023]|uniref:hypothetical protein n=1 Tax=Streptomyces sp. NPDC047023 TaxID=3155139 RepID=UPI0033FB041C